MASWTPPRRAPSPPWLCRGSSERGEGKTRLEGGESARGGRSHSSPSFALLRRQWKFPLAGMGCVAGVFFFSKPFVLCWFPKFARKRSFLLENSSSVAANQKGKGFFSTRASGRRGEPRPAAATCLRTAKSQVGRKPARSAGPSSFSPGLALLLECSAGVSSNPNCPIHSSR